MANPSRVRLTLPLHSEGLLPPLELLCPILDSLSTEDIAAALAAAAAGNAPATSGDETPAA